MIEELFITPYLIYLINTIIKLSKVLATCIHYNYVDNILLFCPFEAHYWSLISLNHSCKCTIKLFYLVSILV